MGVHSELNGHKIVGQTGAGYFVAAPSGEKISGFYASPERALTRLENILRAAQPKRHRACLCCGVTFASEGFHNRMCDTCRHIHDGGLI